MSDSESAAERLLAGLREARAVAAGEVPAAAIHQRGHRYVPESSVSDAQRAVEHAVDCLVMQVLVDCRRAGDEGGREAALRVLRGLPWHAPVQDSHR